MAGEKTQQFESSHNNCIEHRAMVGRLNLILALATAIMGMMGYQTFSQVPDLKTKVSHNEDNIIWLKERHSALASDISQLNSRLTLVEARLKIRKDY